jgi:UDP-N-acetyl-D-mannosaminuronate dehydrogenase
MAQSGPLDFSPRRVNTGIWRIGGQLTGAVKRLQKVDIVLIATDHVAFDYDDLMRYAKLIVDTRNACGARGLTSEKVVKA